MAQMGPVRSDQGTFAGKPIDMPEAQEPESQLYDRLGAQRPIRAERERIMASTEMLEIHADQIR